MLRYSPKGMDGTGPLFEGNERIFVSSNNGNPTVTREIDGETKDAADICFENCSRWYARQIENLAAEQRALVEEALLEYDETGDDHILVSYLFRFEDLVIENSLDFHCIVMTYIGSQLSAEEFDIERILELDDLYDMITQLCITNDEVRARGDKLRKLADDIS